jgi:segregation and condensation protein B
VLDTLLERRLVRIAGRKETVGRPLLYATTPDFLKSFGLNSLENLPSIESLAPGDLPVSAPAAPEPVEQGSEVT